MTVDDMLNRMCADEFTQWIEFYELEPWGEERADLRSGIVAAILRNANKSAEETRVYTPQDFLLFSDRATQAEEGDAPSPPPPDLRAQFMRAFPPQA